MELFTEADHLAEARYRKLLREQPGFVWRRFSDGEELMAYVFFPPGHRAEAAAPSVLFFHGGMWVGKSLGDFVPWALHLAQQGIAGIIPMFRTRGDYEVEPMDILEEGREAWAWLHGNADLLGLDPARITVAGSDAGGLMALHVALPDHPARWSLFRKKAPLPPGPAAVALFRGVCDLTAQSAFKLGGMMPPDQRDAVNPLRRVQRGLPPLFASHGGRDRLLPWRNSERLAELWRKKKNRSRFELLDVADHTFYHFNVNAAYFEQLLNSWSAFMVEQGIWEYNEGMDTGLLG